MISINVAAIRLSQKKLQSVRKTIIEAGDKGYRQKIYYLLEAAAKVSPQFSGDFASNWAIVVDGNMPVYRPLPAKLDGLGAAGRTDAAGQTTYRAAAHKAGDPEAVELALRRGAGTLSRVTMKNKVHLVNATNLYTDGTKMFGPDGSVNLRGDNIIPGNVRIESYVRALAKNPINLRLP